MTHKDIILSVLAGFLVLLTGCSHTGHLTGVKGNRVSPPEYRGVRLEIEGAAEKDVSIGDNGYRLYAWGNGNLQSGALLILKIRGLQPGMKTYWSYEYKKGPYNSRGFLIGDPLSACSGYPFSRRDKSTIADEKGETAVCFTGTTYAGDSFRIGIGFSPGAGNVLQFRDAPVKSKPLVVWKRLYLEQPKILKRVRFPQSTWKLVRSNLEKLNIDVVITGTPVEFDPAKSQAVSHYFTGKEKETRYGPGKSSDLSMVLPDISCHTGDGKPETVNVVIFGAISEEHDLIKGPSRSAAAPPRPVDYGYAYKKKDLNPDEFMSYGTALAMIGDSPTIFIWADYWWVFSRIVKTRHDQALCRVILHELGHHLLRSRLGKAPEVLDEDGHLLEKITLRRSIMNGYKLLHTDGAGRVFFSPNSIRLERKFIRSPSWHPRVETLIRRYYTPLQH